jgi:uncharacterized protein
MTDREFQIFIKPVGAECNLRCSYCYYLEKKALYTADDNPVMDDNLLEKFIVQNIQASGNNVINFSWHGGEPLLAGIEFYRKALKLQLLHKPAGSFIVNGIQTNGTLLNDEWCSFLAEEKFVVGISIDGPGAMHDIHRRTRKGKTTSEEVILGYELLKKHGVIPEILCVVSADNVNNPLIIYNFFKQLGAKFITFLPLVEHLADSSTGVSRNSVPAGAFGYFLSAVFDEWLEKDIGDIKIQIFEETLRTAFNQEHTLCIFKENCGGVPVVGHTGDFYSCDHYVTTDHLLGNIKDKSLGDLLDCIPQKTFGNAKSRTLPKFCLECEVRAMCNGECPRNRFIKTPDGESGLNYLCSGYKYFFNHCIPFVEAIRATWKNQ